VVSRENQPMGTKFERDSSHLIGCLVESQKNFSDYGCANHNTLLGIIKKGLVMDIDVSGDLLVSDLGVAVLTRIATPSKVMNPLRRQTSPSPGGDKQRGATKVRSKIMM